MLVNAMIKSFKKLYVMTIEVAVVIVYFIVIFLFLQEENEAAGPLLKVSSCISYRVVCIYPLLIVVYRDCVLYSGNFSRCKILLFED